MTFLPIAERELRAAARRKGTFRLRGWTAAAAIAVSMMFILFHNLGGRGQLGGALFVTLSWYTFGLCLLAGMVLTADSLSEEKREGTLGLLFLTDLKGYDVVLGKFMGASVNAFYALLAILPILGLPLLMGGVTGGEFWRMALALVNALFVSLTLGTWCSARSREMSQSAGKMFAVLFILVLVVPMLANVQSRPQNYAWWLATSISPVLPARLADETMYLLRPANYWESLLMSNLVGWALLALASFVLPRSWQDQRVAVARTPLMHPRRLAEQKARNLSRRKRTLDINPVLWLAGRNDGSSGWFSALGLMWLGSAGYAAAILYSFVTNSDTEDVHWLIMPVLFVMKVLLATRVCRFFVEARRSGAMELLLCTPLTGKQILSGQWQALRSYLMPFCLVGVIEILNVAIQFYLNWGVHTLPVSGFIQSFRGPFGHLYYLIRTVTDVFAIVWLGMWLGLSAKKPSFAGGWTVLFGVVLPAFAVCVPNLLIDIIVILWAKDKLERHLRKTLLDQYKPLKEWSAAQA
ncbi:MAG: ABC transporter permease subunit [Verrucomicrobiota bacterium]